MAIQKEIMTIGIIVRVGMTIGLTINLAPKNGLCNGTRLMVMCCAPHYIQAKILNGDNASCFHFKFSN
ncbi:hypothetical protein AQUCO_05000043v1 [Aquilegia coerulea]|uniref:DNA helicase Pif1-like 2B domain-containing protein n=1 Tax=Aquilegia coerulea TaxID=218851 RepID=A0A2G5CJ88_AQUCA|nr:hypothetical protein AQUCO_05000043v1 [Aquilegia coerulea]